MDFPIEILMLHHQRFGSILLCCLLSCSSFKWMSLLCFIVASKTAVEQCSCFLRVICVSQCFLHKGTCNLSLSFHMSKTPKEQIVCGNGGFPAIHFPSFPFSLLSFQCIKRRNIAGNEGEGSIGNFLDRTQLEAANDSRKTPQNH